MTREDFDKLAANAERELTSIPYAIFEAAADAIVITDEWGRVQAINAAAQKLFGYSFGELAGASITRLMPKAYAERHDQCLASYRAGGGRKLNGLVRELLGKRKDGSLFDLHVSVGELSLGGRQLLIGVCYDISEQLQMHRRINHLASHDTLTHCMNRSALHERLQQEIALALARGEQLVLVFIDLDGLKIINDNHGHNVGDRVLVGVAERFRQCLAGAGLLARVGGDEFVVVVRQAFAEQGGMSLATRLFDCLQTPLGIDGMALTVRASLGVSTCTNCPEGVTPAPDQLIIDADFAMYQAKKAGGNRIACFNPAMRVTQHREQQRLERLRQAIDAQQLQLHYQPQFELADPQRITGLEALLRWNDGANGPVSPEVFIPLAEQNGLMSALNDWVVTRACADNRALIEAGLLDVPVAVNMSGYSFMQCDFVAKLTAALERSGLAANRLEIEVTETVALKDIEQARQNILLLQGMGVRVSIDDFGTGYSSPSTLRALPFEKLKIDRVFINEVQSNPIDQAIVNGYLMLAESLDIQVVAEGIETRGQLDYLKAQGCSLGQGFWFCRPLPMDRLLQFVMGREHAGRRLVR
ncbi:putative bifunctional diguanylate cyclase/phosphodiesterase [Pseudomonas sp. 2835]|uniref:putative bifunctional diguanylate cyclase/phosphodiesterase n=1 Tax=Pseudomonas sp. 2835 TaxID=3156451 RepID=UPI003D1C94EA